MVWVWFPCSRFHVTYSFRPCCNSMISSLITFYIEHEVNSSTLHIVYSNSDTHSFQEPSCTSVLTLLQISQLSTTTHQTLASNKNQKHDFSNPAFPPSPLLLLQPQQLRHPNHPPPRLPLRKPSTRSRLSCRARDSNRPSPVPQKHRLLLP
jgi:hypothetical protein